LPITAHRREIINAIRENQVVIIRGETGCGKSTQIPKMCLEAGRASRGKIACTQPRRIAAVTIAYRIAEEMGEDMGKSIGYKIRFDDRTPPDALIKILTDGMLLAETHSDPRLFEYDTLIIDEAHERSLNIDFLLGIARTVLPRRPELKLLITSATLDVEKFSQAFDNPPIIEVGGRLFPVEVEYRPPDLASLAPDDADYVEMAVKAVDYLKARQPAGDILIFMPTEQDILETCDRLQGRNFPGMTVLPLFARLPRGHQLRVYSVIGPKIVVATNVAETSLTIPGIKYVVDTGLARISQYLPGTQVNSLPIRPISQSSADQRMGRCGRVKAGLCLRLYSEEDYGSRPRFTPPEILRSNLAEVILRMTDLNLGHPARFPFIDKPPRKSIEDGYGILLEVGAIRRRGEDCELTARGRQMARMPLDPRIGRMLLEAQREGCLGEVAVIASALSVRDPRERPPEKAAEADIKQAVFKDTDSDFITLLNIWNRYHGYGEELRTPGKKKMFCRDHFLSYHRMREWTDIHDQVSEILKELKVPAGKYHKREISKDLYAAIHKSILSGYLSNIAVHKEKNVYAAAKSREVMVFPGSTLFNKSRPWIMAAEMVKTTRLYARSAARIEPGWVEPLAADLCRYSYSEPRWEKSRGEVRAIERVTLFGLEIVSGRDVGYGRVNPEECHQIFIKDALIAGNVRESFAFLKHNLELKEKLSIMEEKLRRRDILVSDKLIFDFYSRRLAGAGDIRGLRERIERRGGEDFLMMRESDLLQFSPDKGELALYPDELSLAGRPFSTSYRFSPGEESDGITLKIPAALLGGVEPEPLEWSVPGLLREKIAALIKGLPKRCRKLLMPISETADIIVKDMGSRDGSLFESLARFVKQRFKADIPAAEWAAVEIPRHLKMRIALTDHRGEILTAGRDLEALKRARPETISAPREDEWRAARAQWERMGLASWDFGALPEAVSIGPSLIAFPGLEPAEKGVNLRLFKSRAEALASHERGVQALFLLKFSKDLEFMRRRLTLPEEYAAPALYFGGKSEVERMISERLKAEAFRKNLRSDKEFQDYAQTLGRALFEKGHGVWELTLKTISAYEQARKSVDQVEKTGRSRKIIAALCGELRKELEALIPKNFLEVYSLGRLAHLPRYLKCLQLRAERALSALEKDSKKAAQVNVFIQALHKMRKALTPQSSPEKAAAVEEFRWMVEEFKVSLFAPELKTAYPVSLQRLLRKQKEICAME
jgi:ATP-dependent helicase HrpA